jgi:predicted nucleotidyltransferase component of viral defense system
MRKPPRNLGASVGARLRNVAKQRNQDFQLVLTRFALERFLYRLSRTRHRDRFVLKGAMLVATWLDDPHRPTRDVDFLGFGDPSPEAILSAFREICAVAVEDGIAFDAAALRVERVREELEYGGLRIRTMGTVGGALAHVVIDVGFGDAIEPGIEETELPVLLDLPAPRLKAYARETVIAEKFQAMVMLGRANSRMKDYYDIWVLSRTHEFADDRLARAIAATFARRQTEIPVEPPQALSVAFAADPIKLRQWDAFAIDIATQPEPLGQVIDDLVAFLMPHAARARTR